MTHINDERYFSQGIDGKKLVILFLKRLYVILAGVVVCALLGAGIYLFSNVLVDRNRQYTAVSKLYLEFAPDETGEVYQAYNGYTWNDLISTDLILPYVMENASSDISEQDVASCVSADILSDVRVLTITVTTDSASKTASLIAAVDKAIEGMAERQKEFISIKTIEEGAAELLIADDRLFQAVLLGAVIGLLIMIAGLYLYYVLEDTIYIPNDWRGICDYPFIGYSEFSDVKGKSLDVTKEKTPKLYKLKEDFETNLHKIEEKKGKASYLMVDMSESFSDDNWKVLRSQPGLILQIPYKKISRKYLQYIMSQLDYQECDIVGISIAEADSSFINMYY